MLTDTTPQETIRLLRTADRALHALSTQLADRSCATEQMLVIALIQQLNKIGRSLDGHGALVKAITPDGKTGSLASKKG